MSSLPHTKTYISFIHYQEPDGWNDDEDTDSPSVILSEPEEEKVGSTH